MDESVIFTTEQNALSTSLYSAEQAVLRQCSTSSRNSAVRVGDKYLFVAQSNKALINVYNISGAHKRETVEQRLPTPEVITCLEVIQNRYEEKSAISDFELPHLLLGSTDGGKIYCWELNSGALLSVKQMAHYQGITKIKSFMDGKYFITSGKDSRVIVWQTIDFVSNNASEPKPICILHDHNLTVNDIAVSMTHGANMSTSGAKLFTASEDSTVRCYDFSFLRGDFRKNRKSQEQDQKMYQPRLLATFTFPAAIEAMSLDPADRALYVGTSEGLFSLPLYYTVKGTSTVANLAQASGSNRNKLYSVVIGGHDDDYKKLFSMGQLVCDKLISTPVTKLELTFDATTILVGNKFGRISVVEIASKQILKTLQPLTTADTEEDAITNIIVTTVNNSRQDSILEQHQSNKNVQKLPVLQRVVHDKDHAKHEVWYRAPETPEFSHELESLPPIADFEKYMDSIRSEETVFLTTETTSQVKNVKQELAPASHSNSQEHQELQQELQQVKSAYKELRELHESLFKEHEQLLSSMK
ncbi:Trp-Asp (WD) repeats profile [Nakaseomyces glabratus]|nr:Trp-Asp (WD) repeats profile [Nakaseomyces glabratus]KAH7585541.1 Trp-Asp (WD) repeats profile [Nakaseomyces glabratus]